MGGAFSICCSTKQKKHKKGENYLEEILRKDENRKNEKNPMQKVETKTMKNDNIEIQDIILQGKTENLNETLKNKNEKEAQSRKIHREEPKKTKSDINEIKEITSGTTKNPKKIQITDENKEQPDGGIKKKEDMKYRNELQILKNSENNESTKISIIVSNFEHIVPNQKDNSSIGKLKKSEIEESQTILKKLGNQNKSAVVEDKISEINITENEDTVFKKLGNQKKDTQITKGQNFDDFISNLPPIDYEDLILLEKLGEGGFGFVQKAFCKSTAQYIALKIYKHQESRTKEQLLEDILYEDDLLTKVEAINNPMYFLKYYGIFKDPKPNSNATFPIILQMENGSMSLEDVLQADIKFDPNEILSFLRDISKGFQILEENHIANRDIKPANIILWTNNDSKNLKKKTNYLFKISDFGIGCDLKSENTNPKGFSKSFAAPEVIKHDPNIYDPIMADVYSLGITALKMIDYKADDLEKSLKTLQFKPLWEEVHDVLEKMLKKNPQERITFKALHESLSEIPIKEIDQTKYFELCCKNKERRRSQDVYDLIELYFEHYKMMKLYLNLTRIDKYRFHASLALDIFEELNARKAIYGLKIHKREDNKSEKEDKRNKIPAKHQILLYCLIGRGFLELNQLEKAAKMLDNAFTAFDQIYDLSKINEELKENNYQAKGLKLFTLCNSYMGSYYKKAKNLERAEKFHQKAYEIGKKIKLDEFFKFDVFSGISLLWIAINKLDEAEKLLLECLKFEKLQNNDFLLGLIDFFLARTLHKKEKASEAEKYCEKAIEKFIIANGGFCESSIYSNILMGKCRQILGDNIKAEQYVKKAIEIFEKNSEEKVEDIEKFKERMEILQDEHF